MSLLLRLAARSPALRPQPLLVASQHSLQQRRTIADNPKPKRAPSAYMLYLQESRSSLPPDMKPQQRLQKLSEQWRGLSEPDKQKFVDLAAVKRQEYVVAFAEFSAKRIKPPRKPRTAYTVFSSEMIRNKSGGRVQDAMTGAGVQWRSLSDSDKQKYVKLAEAEPARYEKELKEYHKKIGPANVALIAELDKMKAPTAAAIFNQMKKTNKKAAKEYVNQTWATISADEKAVYEQEREKAKEKNLRARRAFIRKHNLDAFL